MIQGNSVGGRSDGKILVTRIRLTGVVASTDAQFLLDFLEASASGWTILVARLFSQSVVIDLFF